MNPHSKTTIRRPAAVFVMIAVLAVAGCGTGASDPAAVGTSQVVDASGISSTLPDGSSPTTVPGNTVPGGTAPGGTAPPPPSPAPAPTTPPPPPTTVPPPAAPISIDLTQSGDWLLYTTGPDGAGGSGEYQQESDSTVGLVSWAWHGYNGSNTTTAEYSSQFDATPSLIDLGTDLALVTVKYRVVGNGEIKAPWDRGAGVRVDVEGGLFGTPVSRRLIETYTHLDAELDDPRPFSFDRVDEFSFYVTPGNSIVYFTVVAECSAWSGSAAFALLNEGYCDMHEAGGLTVAFADATISSIEWLEANGIDHPAPPQ